jgi:lambda family phage minor tail protein L
MTDLIDLVQLQEIGDSLVDLFEITLPNGTVVRFVSGLEDGQTNLYFPSSVKTAAGRYTPHEYYALPIQVTEIDFSTSGPLPRPSLTMANIPVLARTLNNNYDGLTDEVTLRDTLDAEGIYGNRDLLGSRVVCRKTLKKYTFSGNDVQQGTASISPPVEFPTQTFIIDRVAGENEIMVEFELASPIDVEGVVVPGRIIVGKYCSWTYQGQQVGRQGGCDWPANSNGRFYDVTNSVITKDISTIAQYSTSTSYSVADRVKTVNTGTGWFRIWEAKRSVPPNRYPPTNKGFWRRLDVCSKTIEGCKVRFQGNPTDETLDTSNALPFGGFPGTKKFK